MSCGSSLVSSSDFLLPSYTTYWISFVFLSLLQCSSHTFPGGTDQRRAGSSGAAGLWGAAWTRRRLWGRGPGRVAEETSRAEGPECAQQSSQAGTAPVRTLASSGYKLSCLWSAVSLNIWFACFLTGWRKRRCASRSWGRESGCPTMRWWRDFGGSWQRGRRNALQPRRRRTRPWKRWRRGRASSSCWTDRRSNSVCLVFTKTKCWKQFSPSPHTHIRTAVQWSVTAVPVIQFTAGVHDWNRDISVVVVMYSRKRNTCYTSETFSPFVDFFFLCRWNFFNVAFYFGYHCNVAKTVHINVWINHYHLNMAHVCLWNILIQ